MLAHQGWRGILAVRLAGVGAWKSGWNSSDHDLRACSYSISVRGRSRSMRSIHVQQDRPPCPSGSAFAGRGMAARTVHPALCRCRWDGVTRIDRAAHGFPGRRAPRPRDLLLGEWRREPRVEARVRFARPMAIEQLESDDERARSCSGAVTSLNDGDSGASGSRGVHGGRTSPGRSRCEAGCRCKVPDSLSSPLS